MDNPLKPSTNMRNLYALSGFNTFQASDVYFCNVFVAKLKKCVTRITVSIRGEQVKLDSVSCIYCSMLTHQ